MNYLIIGNGIAGTEAAVTIRKNDSEGDITIVSESNHLFYYRPALIEYLSDKTTVEKITLYKEDFYRKNSITCLLGTKIVKIAPGEKAVYDTAGKKYAYDRLLIATGALPSLPPFAGSDLKGVFTLRGITDADGIKSYCKNAEEIVVMGGGLLGLETASSLASTGNKVTVIEFFEWLLPRQLDREGGKILQGMLEERGLRFVLGDSVDSVTGNGAVESVKLKSGREIKAGAVIVSAGIKGRSELAVDAGLTVNKGIVVDDYLRTSAEDIYAAGDPVEHAGCLYGIYPAARDQGRIAGLNMAGVKTGYMKTMMSNVLKVSGIDLYSAGDFNAADAQAHTCSIDSGYTKFLIRDNPIAAIVLGDASAVKIAQKVMEGKAHPDELIQVINAKQAETLN